MAMPGTGGDPFRRAPAWRQRSRHPAVEHSPTIEDIGEDPDRWLVIGTDRAGNLLAVRGRHPNARIVLDTTNVDQPGVPPAMQRVEQLLGSTFPSG
jgi:hypothetical protein